METGGLVILLIFLGLAWSFELKFINIHGSELAPKSKSSFKSTSISECGIMYANQVSKQETKIIVNKHNELRKLIANGKVPGQPRGVNLKRMKYDHKLAAEAQKIANLCKFAHKTVSDDRWHAVGQNLFIKYSTGKNGTADWNEAVQAWFDEHVDYKYGVCCEKGSKMTGHYTQVVWADTEYVGCGYAYFGANDYWKYQRLYVCNYGPAGNYVGDLPYKTGNSGCEDLC